MYDASSTTLRFYVDGVLAGERDYEFTWAGDGPLRVGRGQNNGGTNGGASGSIDDIVVFDAALGEENIRRLVGADTADDVSRQQSAQAPEAGFDDSVAVGPVPVVPLDEVLGSSDPPARLQSDDTLWPQQVSATVTLAPNEPVQAGDAPVWLSATAVEPDTRVTVEVMDQAASAAYGGQVAVRLATDAADPAAQDLVQVKVDYTGFQHAMGGDYGSRLVANLIDPTCVDAGGTDCMVQTLDTVNDPVEGTVTATVPVATASSGSGTVLALTPEDSGPAGDWSASPLRPSSLWSHGGSSGGFTWSYPLRTPAMPGGLKPDLSIDYSSQSVDGRTTSTNNQTSWIGEGFDLSTGFIERRYIPCARDMDGDANNADHETGDLCWKSDNAVLNLGGTSTELIKDAATGQWHPKRDDGSRVEHLTGGDNDDNNGEYWRVTASDGVQYYFGIHKRYTEDTANTYSSLHVPVAGNHPGEPCHAAQFADSFCDQVWRWMLAYVVDPDGNTMTYTYAREHNRYGQNLDDTTADYIRASLPVRIEYGERRGSEHTTEAPARVVFTTAERCLGANCDPADLTEATADDWPDVPFDRICDSTDSCPQQFSPTFFSRKRLIRVEAQVLRTDGAYEAVDEWDLEHGFPDPGDGNDPALWLKSIQHAGSAGSGSITLPKVLFYGIQLPNRVDGIDSAPPLNRWRLRAIRSETGAVTSINYADPECSVGNVPANEHDNGMRCFPVYWNFEGSGETEPHRHWFHKHVVESIVETDRTGGGVSVDTRYTYGGDAAWAYDDNEFVDADYRTWGQWRGCQTVTTTVGHPDTDQLVTKRLYLRGMHGDRATPSGGSRSVQVTDSHGNTVTDYEEHAGFVREEIVYNNGQVVSSTVHDPWRSPVTADDGDHTARMTDVAATRTYTMLETGDYRVSETGYTYDNDGLPIEVDDRGDVSTTGDDRCTHTEYAKNTTEHILDTVKRAETVAVGCGETPTRPDDVVSDKRLSYDGHAYGQAPTRGHVTQEQVLDDWDAGGASYVTTSSMAYDTLGRVTTATDGLNRATTTAYTPAASGPLTTTVVTNPAGHTTTTTFDRYTGQPVRVTDANGKVTEATYDQLGRLRKVWYTDRDKATQTASVEYAYRISADQPVAVTTKSLLPDGSYTSSVQLLDSLLRQRQTQAPSARDGDTGRIITSTEYDSRGLPVTIKGPFYNDTTGPDPTVVDPKIVDPALTVQRRTENTFDGAGRKTLEQLWSHQTLLMETATSYGGDRVHTTPPDGGTATTVITDARGNIVEKRDYTASGTPTGAFQATTYTYTSRDQLATVTDPASNTWTYDYDLRGRRTVVDDPDAGVSTTTYDVMSQVASTTDARGETLTYTYDVLGRKTALRDGSGTLVSRWIYDTLKSGKLTASESLVAGEGTPDTQGLNLLGSWDFDDATGTVAQDGSGHGNNAALLNGAERTALGQGGTDGVRVGADGGYLATDDTVVPTAESFTVSAWVRVDENPSGDQLVLRETAGGSSVLKLYYRQGTGKWRFEVSSVDGQGRTWHPLDGAEPVTLGAWTHLVGVFDADAGELELYVNGELVDSRIRVTAQPATSQLRIAGDATWGQLAGAVDTVRAWSGAATADQIASWYDAAATAYTRRVTGYDDAYRPLGETVTIPASQGDLAGSYTSRWAYNVDGSVDLQSRPAIGGLPEEVLDYHYDRAGNQEWVSGARTYAADASYTPYGELEQLALGANYRRGAWQTVTYTEGTRRLDRVRVDLEGVNEPAVNRSYGFDEAGNPQWIVDDAGADDRQCFGYDHLRRLTQAWTQDVSGCVTDPTTDVIGGPAPYWYTYTYDQAGNRTQLIDHGIGGDPDTTTTYTYPQPGQPQPHAVQSLQVGSSWPTNFSYDAAGNTISKTERGVEHPDVWPYTWDAQGRLVEAGYPGWFGSITGSMIYDADGTRLIRENPGTLASDTTVTLFVHGDEITLNTNSGNINAVRYYTLAGKTIAVQQGHTDHTQRVVSTTITDHFGTPLVSIDENNQVTKRFQDPFGNHRGGTTDLPGDLGFHTGTEDNRTNLIHMGARQYDPTTGRFLSIDPLIDPLDSQQINGYTYANNNPLTYTDPTGTRPIQGITDHTGPGYSTPDLEPPLSNSSRDTVKADGPVDDQSVTDGDNTAEPDELYKLLAQGISELRDFANNRNGSNRLAISFAREFASSCEIGRRQIVCYEAKLWLTGGAPFTVGDVFFYPGSQDRLDYRLEIERLERSDLAAHYGSEAAEMYGPDLLRHEAVHSDQWARVEYLDQFLIPYMGENVKSFFTPWTLFEAASSNKYEVEANLYWGGYKDGPPRYPSPSPLPPPSVP